MMRTEWFMLCLLGSDLFIACAGCHRSSHEPPQVEAVTQSKKTEAVSRPEIPSQNFSGSQSCKECHEEIVELFANHPMGMSAGSLATGPVLENYESTHFLASNRLAYSAIRKEDGTVIHREQKLYRPVQAINKKDNLPGKERPLAIPVPKQQPRIDKSVYQLDHVVKYYLGSGQRGRSYLLQKDGLLLQSPITWYSESKQWDLSPGYTNRNSHFERRIIDGCVTCHVGRMATDPDGRANLFAVSHQQNFVEETTSQSPVPEKSSEQSHFMIEAAISCERCHGPAASHVEYQQGNSKDASLEKDPILLIEKMNPRQRESLCNQCHLVGVNRILRYGRTEYDFRPGDDLSDIWITFVNGTGVQGNLTEAVSHVEQMHSSICYQKSSGEMDCTSCHDPHSIPGKRQRIAFYRSKCLTCHADEQSECSMPLIVRKLQTPEDSCIVCHMPSLAASDVPHTSQTDHRVLRNPKKHIQSLSQAKDEKLIIFDQAEKRLPQPATDRAKALLLTIYAQRDRDIYLARAASKKLEPLLKYFPDDTQLIVSLGTMSRQYGSTQKAKEYLEKALLLNPQQEEALLQLGLLSHELRDYEKGIDYLQRYLEINPWNRDATGRQIHMLGQTNQIQLGIQKAKQALLKFPDNWQIRGWLIDAYQKSDRLDDVKKHSEIYHQVKPDRLK